MKKALGIFFALLLIGCRTREYTENAEPSEPIEYRGNAEPIEIETVDEINKIAQGIADVFSYSVTMLSEMERTHIQPDPFARIQFNEGICTTYAILFYNALDKKGYEVKYVADWDMTHVWNLVILDNREIHFDVTGYDERTRGGIWIEEDDEKYLWASSHPVFDEYVYLSDKYLERMRIPVKN